MGVCCCARARRRRLAKRLEQTTVFGSVLATVGQRGRPGRQNLVCIVGGGGDWAADLQGKRLALLRRHPGLAFLLLVSRRGSQSEGE